MRCRLSSDRADRRAAAFGAAARRGGNGFQRAAMRTDGANMPRPSSGTAPRSSPGPRSPSRGPDPQMNDVWFRYGTFVLPARSRSPGRRAPPDSGGRRRSLHDRRTHDRRTENVEGATRAGRGRGGGGNEPMRSIRCRRPARAVPERPRFRYVRIRSVRRQDVGGAGRPRSPGRPRAPRGRWSRRPWRRPAPAPGRRSRRASRSRLVRVPRARISRPSAFDASREPPDAARAGADESPRVHDVRPDARA